MSTGGPLPGVRNVGISSEDLSSGDFGAQKLRTIRRAFLACVEAGEDGIVFLLRSSGRDLVRGRVCVCRSLVLSGRPGGVCGGKDRGAGG